MDGSNNHPMANPKQTQKIVAQIRDNETPRALGQATYWLNSLKQTAGYRLVQRFENINLVDTSTRKHQAQILDDYLAMALNDKKQEKLLWEAAGNFWATLGDAYIACLDLAEQDRDASGSFKSTLPLIAARAARATAMQMRWVLMRYGLVEPRIWKHLARCCRFAEAHHIGDAPVSLYVSGKSQSTAMHEITQALLLAASSSANLAPVVQDITAQLIEHLSDRCKISQQPELGLHFQFDLDRATPPGRAGSVPATSPTRRFFGAPDALPLVNDCLNTLRAGGALPASLRVRHGDTRQIVEALEHLALNWAEQPPERAWDRRITAAGLAVVHGYNGVRAALDDTQGQSESGFVADHLPDFWIVENAGRGGYRAVVPAGESSWLTVGALIAVRLEYNDVWSAAVVRRVESDEYRQRRVGIRLIARKPAAVQLRARLPGGGVSAAEPGILLNTRATRGGGVHVLMRPGSFTLKDDIEAVYGTEKNLLLLNAARPIETGADYQWTRYQLQAHYVQRKTPPADRAGIA